MPRYLHRDRDAIYGDLVRQRVAAMGIEEIVNAGRSPWQSPFAGRLIGSLRRECINHMIALGEAHLRRVLRSCAEHYSRSRCHMSLEGNAPEPREIEDGPGSIRAIPHLGGLHPRYTRAA